MEQSLGKRIVQNRKRLGLTQEQLAEQMGVTAQAVSKWENDQSCPDISVLPRLADIFGITLDELLGRSQEDAVYTGEVVQAQEENEDKKGNFELTWDSGKKNAIGFAVFVISSGILYLLSQILSWEVSFWDILWPSALVFFGATGLAPRFSFFRLGCLLLGAYFLVGKLIYIPLKLDSGILFALVVVLFGGSLLVDALKKSRKPKFSMTYTDKTGKVHRGECHNDYEYTADTFTYSASFGNSRQQVYLDTLAQGEISTSFGEYTVDLTQIASTEPGCHLDVSCSFGELTILLPRHIGLRLENSTSFADIHTEGYADSVTTGLISIEASASFGEIEIRYV